MSKELYILIRLTDFQALLGVDERKDGLYFASVRNTGSEFLHGKNSTTLSQPQIRLRMGDFCHCRDYPLVRLFPFFLLYYIFIFSL
jgi:hypothetical protein